MDMGASSDPRLVRLLDVEPEIGARLRDDDRAEARERLLLRVTDVAPGDWTLEACAARPGRPFGVLVLDGLLLQEVRLAGRSTLQLLGSGDLVLPRVPAADALAARLRWTAAVPSRVAVLDDRVQAPFALWPGLAIGLAELAGRQLTRLAVQAAIGQLPRVDQRLEATFWELAERWGRVTPSGVHVPLALTHEVLARLVGGRRPTITLALTELAERGVLIRRPDRTWLLTAAAPTLAGGDHQPAAAPLPSLAATADPPPAALRADPPLWQPDARAELLQTAIRMNHEHAQRRHRLAADMARYAEVRRRSRELRADLAELRSPEG
jgi:hypothetical protein